MSPCAAAVIRPNLFFHQDFKNLKMDLHVLHRDKFMFVKKEAWLRIQRIFSSPMESYDHCTEIVKLEECKRDLF